MSKSIKSYVLFDTESTGLPSPGNNPRITELCLMAVTREEIMSRQRNQRVINKLNLCVDPCKQIHHRSSELTGLHNDSLSFQATFREQADLIVAFLRNLPQPTCLLAHNGHRFDFPLLKAELERSHTTLSENVHCADTIEAFRVLDGLPPISEFVAELDRQRKLLQVEASKSKPGTSSVVLESKEKRNSDQMGVDNGKGLEMNLSGKKKRFDCDKGNVTEMKTLLQQQNQNERTPKRKTSTPLSFSHQCRPNNCDKADEDDQPQRLSNSEVHFGNDNVRVHFGNDNVRKRLFKSPKLSLKSSDNNDKDEPDEELINSVIAQDSCCSTSLNYSVIGNGDNSADDSNRTECYFNPDSTVRSSTELSQDLHHYSISDSDKYFLEACDEVDLPNGNSGLKPNNDSKIIITSESNKPVDSDTKRHRMVNPTMTQVVKEKEEEVDKKHPKLDTTLHNVMKRSSVSVQNCSNDSTHSSRENITTNFDNFMKQSLNVSSHEAAVPPQSTSVRKSYALGKLYRFYFGQEPDVAHTAEDDCKTLLKLISLNVDKFISYCDQNAILFSNIEPMY